MLAKECERAAREVSEACSLALLRAKDSQDKDPRRQVPAARIPFSNPEPFFSERLVGICEHLALLGDAAALRFLNDLEKVLLPFLTVEIVKGRVEKVQQVSVGPGERECAANFPFPAGDER